MMKLKFLFQFFSVCLHLSMPKYISPGEPTCAQACHINSAAEETEVLLQFKDGLIQNEVEDQL